eukprot:CAMPEP_0181291828 /NCGR_PEP_ID=MMETSP1101-20121128/2179_1 /TAXON_ID=46948 /ORGANISM="Rhodomonas abbreviata, Strain Caron Lab Isolate" /LENGTH=249 /DNA_ID=CAMNT_0023396253 /DNA_START=249 /DNA_END=994 /DNA_ORIENTATION=+
MAYGALAQPQPQAQIPPMPQLMIQPAPSSQPAPIAQQGLHMQPQLPQMPQLPPPPPRNVLGGGQIVNARQHVQLGPAHMGRGGGPPNIGQMGISFAPLRKIIPKRVFEDADESDVSEDAAVHSKTPKIFSMIWPKMFLLRVVGYVCRLFFKQDDLVTNTRDQLKRDMREPMTERDLKRMACVMCEIASLQGGPENLAMSAVLRMQDDGNLWMVVDSGANRHYVCTERFLCHIRPAISMVYGVGDVNVQT